MNWRPRFAGQTPQGDLRSWLCEPGSLTRRCQRRSQAFHVQVLRSERGRPLADRAPGALCRVREVLLECDGQPVIFAHTLWSTAIKGSLRRWLLALGSRSLGSLLFTHPGFTRGRLEFCRLPPQHPLARRVRTVMAARGAALPAQWPLWARRSTHSFAGQSLLVVEVFLPPILAL